jgi:acetyl-CoA carboxylase biotin carboxyl carrier protein
MRSEREALNHMLDIMHEHDLDALTVRVGKSTYELVRRAEAHLTVAVPPNAESAQHTGVHSPSLHGQHAGAQYKKVTAPIIGVFYQAPAPGAEPFVEVGSQVEVGQVLCILEAMKLMNEITSDYAGTVRRILPDNGALVSLGEELFWIEP